MSKLTRKQRASIENALHHLERAFLYIMSPHLALCVRDTPATTSVHYTRADGATMYEVERAIGSDLCGMEFAIRELQTLLKKEEPK